jgi:hypothetical protein
MTKLSKKLSKYLIDGISYDPTEGTNIKLLELVVTEGHIELLEAFKIYNEQTIIATLITATRLFKGQLERFSEPQPINSKNLLKVIREVKQNG